MGKWNLNAAFKHGEAVTVYSGRNTQHLACGGNVEIPGLDGKYLGTMRRNGDDLHVFQIFESVGCPSCGRDIDYYVDPDVAQIRYESKIAE